MRRAWLILTGLLALAARAADGPTPAADSIADAKKDIASIKAQAPGDASVSLPSLQMKDVGTVPGAPAVQLPSLTDQEKADALDPSKKKRGTGNWLVDAMDKKADSAKDSRGRERDDLLKGENDPLKTDEKEGGAADSTRERAEAKASVYNPLDSFMGGWISAKDHDLLIPAGKPDGLPGAEGARGRGELLPGLDLGASASAVENLVSPADVSVLSDASRGAANPYLALLEAPAAPQFQALSAPGAFAGPAAGPADFARGISSSGPAPRQSEGERSFVPDFAQPPDDDKYFRQMKKF